jgi:hypothetical protein
MSVISDEDVKRLFMNVLNQHGGRNTLLNIQFPEGRAPQFYRGIAAINWENQHPGGCKRHTSVFAKYKIIPRYCFNCYKIGIAPRTVVELFKLMLVLDQLVLPNDNTRKCMVENREQVSGAYKGLIYCRGLEEGREIVKMMDKVISGEISENIPVTLKRGCTEYGLAYPEYARIGQGMIAMEYKEEWQVYEDMEDRKFVANTQPSLNDTNNRPTYTLKDVRAMLYWLKYAAMIGDRSYLKISGEVIPPLANLKRPSPFFPVEDE